ncbi:MAG TPA: NYN domain-containing protein [Syntrophales bacterium]|nr:NYN domain-containing protein [Syntrophales bacterium]
MANILIDGYNLIGIAHRDIEKARHDLIQKLGAYAKVKQHNITVVFDGWKSGQAVETQKRTGGITVIYSQIGEKADDVIKDMLSSGTKSWIAVSSDREIYDFAEKKNFVALTADQFEEKLFLALDAMTRNNDKERWEDDDDLRLKQTGKKGNPQKLSRKEKRKIEALKAL